MSEQSYCPNCGAPGAHYVVPGLGEAGFFICSAPASKPPAPMVVGSDPFSLAIKQYFSEPHHGTATSEMLNCASTFWLAGYREGKRDLTAAQLEIDRLKAELLWCVEVLESQRHEMDNEGNISTHVSEGKLEELQAIVANQRKEQKS